MSWACDLVAEMLLILETIFDLIIQGQCPTILYGVSLWLTDTCFSHWGYTRRCIILSYVCWVVLLNGIILDGKAKTIACSYNSGVTLSVNKLLIQIPGLVW